jgi:hypothetical protein
MTFRNAYDTSAGRILPSMSVTSRVPAFLLLGLVLVAAALLIAGYGVPVGIGVIAGLLLGGAVSLAFVGLSPRSGHGGMFMWSRGGPANEPDHVLIQRHGRDSMRVAGVDASALRRVISLGDAVEASGARVELMALEIREDGAIATFVAHTRPPVGQVGHFVEVTVSDEAGTAYLASGQGSGAQALEPAGTKSASRPRRPRALTCSPSASRRSSTPSLAGRSSYAGRGSSASRSELRLAGVADP